MQLSDTWIPDVAYMKARFGRFSRPNLTRRSALARVSIPEHYGQVAQLKRRPGPLPSLLENPGHRSRFSKHRVVSTGARMPKILSPQSGDAPDWRPNRLTT